MIILTETTAELHNPLARPLAAVAAAFHAALARRKARYDARRYLACDDRLLRDAGTTRQDLRHALQERAGR